MVADRPGYLTVFNVGPTGHLNLLYPEPLSADSPAPVEAHRPLHILGRRDDAAGRPRAAVRRLDPPAALAPPRSVAQSGRTQKGDPPASRPYVATRDMKRVQQSVQQLRPEDWHAVVLELDHGA